MEFEFQIQRPMSLMCCGGRFALGGAAGCLDGPSYLSLHKVMIMSTDQSTDTQKPAPESAGELTNPSLTPEGRYRMIAEAAYFRAEKRGFTGDDMEEDWRQAEDEVDRILESLEKMQGLGLTEETFKQRVMSILEGDVSSIAERMRAHTLHALSSGEQAKERFKEVMEAAVRDAYQGASQRVEHGAQALKEAIRGVDAALAESVTATQSAIKEAAERTEEFSQETLKKAADNIHTLESQFVETLKDAAQYASGFGKSTLQGLANQARKSGTAVGERAKSLTHTVTDTAREQVQRGEDALHREATQLANMTAMKLREMASRLQSPSEDKEAAPSPKKTKKG